MCIYIYICLHIYSVILKETDIGGESNSETYAKLIKNLNCPGHSLSNCHSRRHSCFVASNTKSEDNMQ